MGGLLSCVGCSVSGLGVLRVFLGLKWGNLLKFCLMRSPCRYQCLLDFVDFGGVILFFAIKSCFFICFVATMSLHLS